MSSTHGDRKVPPRVSSAFKTQLSRELAEALLGLLARPYSGSTVAALKADVLARIAARREAEQALARFDALEDD